jgi:hypothetical protein
MWFFYKGGHVDLAFLRDLVEANASRRKTVLQSAFQIDLPLIILFNIFYAIVFGNKTVEKNF